MMKRMMFLAAGVIASLAFTASARANTVFMVDSTVEVLSGTATTVTDTFSGPVSSFDGYLSGTSPTPVSETMSGNTIKFTYSPAPGPGAYTLNFLINSTSSTLLFNGTTLSAGANGGGFGTVTAVPEPASLALLGIGMTSFLAFRRLFKRNPVV